LNFNKLLSLNADQKAKLLQKEAPGFLFDFSVWCYRTSQKRSAFCFGVAVMLKFYGLSHAGMLQLFILVVTSKGLERLHKMRLLVSSRTYLQKYSVLETRYLDDLEAILQTFLTGKPNSAFTFHFN
jgi:hypothetical protein